MRELKTKDFKQVFAQELERKKDFVSDCTIDTDLEILIPDAYVSSVTERLALYTQLDNIDDDDELKRFSDQLIDRFGPMPKQVTELFTTIRCRRLACELGFEKLILKNEQMRLYFISDADSSYFESATFHNILDYIQKRTNKARLKQVGKNFMLIVDDIKNMNHVLWFLEGIISSLPATA
jgi:transcription-repair coupling factor (superfamily II helicase)